MGSGGLHVLRRLREVQLGVAVLAPRAGGALPALHTSHFELLPGVQSAMKMPAMPVGDAVGRARGWEEQLVLCRVDGASKLPA